MTTVPINAAAGKLLRVVLVELTLPVTLLAVVYALRAGWPQNAVDFGMNPGPAAVDQGAKLLAALCWLAIGFLFNRGVRLLIWRGLFARMGINIPGLLVTLVEILVWLATFAVVITGVYGQSMTALLATSTVLIGVAGFALQRLIADFFSGIVLGVENPFGIGDWVQVEPSGLVGKVIEFNWRSTRLLTTENVVVVVPNSQLVVQPFRNYSRPQPYFREEIRIPLPFEVTTYQGQRILLSAVNQIDEIASLPVSPSVSILEYDSRGVIWQLLYWIPDRGRQSAFRFMVHQNILRNLHYAGLQIPVPHEEKRRPPVPDPDPANAVVRMLHHSSLFADLRPEEMRKLALGAMQRIYPAKEPVLRQGNPGSSLFVLNEGLLSVWVASANGIDQQVAQIHPGEFFGELSLLTGAPRGATVIPVTDCLITEIGKDAMSELLTERPELAESLSRILASRQAANARSQAATQSGADTDANAGIARMILGQIRAFFNLGKR